ERPIHLFEASPLSAKVRRGKIDIQRITRARRANCSDCAQARTARDPTGAGKIFPHHRAGTGFSGRRYCAADAENGVDCLPERAQDSLYETILNWLPATQFLPEAEFAAVENVLPDPEIAAERLALLAKIDSEPGPHVIVTTRASLEQPAPKRGAVSAATLKIKRGATSTMGQLLEKLSGSGYER